MAVGAQHVGEDVGVAAVVLVAREPVAAPQALDMAARDDDDRQLRRRQGVDDRAVGTLDGDPADLAGGEPPSEVPQTLRIMLDLEAFEHRSGLVDDADRVAPARPVDARVRGGGRGGGRMHPCLLAGPFSLGAPFTVTGRVRRSLTDGAQMARSPIAARHVPGCRTPRDSTWPSNGEREWRWSGPHQGVIGGMAPVDPPEAELRTGS